MSTELMAPRKNKRSNASMAIAQAIINGYQPKNAEEMQDALKDIFGPMFEAILQGEMDSHLGGWGTGHGGDTVAIEDLIKETKADIKNMVQ